VDDDANGFKLLKLLVKLLALLVMLDAAVPKPVFALSVADEK
jgi:hypothetical protein